MRISDWSSDVCSSDLKGLVASGQRLGGSCGVACEVPWRKVVTPHGPRVEHRRSTGRTAMATRLGAPRSAAAPDQSDMAEAATRADLAIAMQLLRASRSEEHTSELQSLMRSSYAVFCLKTKSTN